MLGMKTKRRLLTICLSMLIYYIFELHNEPMLFGKVDGNEKVQYRPKFSTGCRSEFTLITAFYDLGERSKHSSTEYSRWNEQFLTMEDSMVIFTSQKFVQQVVHQRRAQKGCTLLVVQDLKDTYIAKSYNWTQQAELDPEKRIHQSSDLYVIWNQKSFWLAQVAFRNPFHSQFFLWTDIGQFRTGYPWPGEKWIQVQNFPRKKIVLLSIHPFSEEEQELSDAGFAQFFSSLSARIGGGNFGGDRSAILLWKREYHLTLERYINMGQFAGKDQSLMASTCIQNPTLCFIIDAKDFPGDPWFALQAAFHSKTLIGA